MVAYAEENAFDRFVTDITAEIRKQCDLWLHKCLVAYAPEVFTGNKPLNAAEKLWLTTMVTLRVWENDDGWHITTLVLAKDESVIIGEFRCQVEDVNRVIKIRYSLKGALSDET